jgi:hypothetical protein
LQCVGSWARDVPPAVPFPTLKRCKLYKLYKLKKLNKLNKPYSFPPTRAVISLRAGSDPPIFGKPVWDYYYQFEHYRPVVELGAARFARSPEQLAEHVNAYLADPSLDREGRRKLAEMQVGVPVGESCRRVVDVLRGIARD